MTTATVSQAATDLEFAMKLNKPLLMLGAPGVGKSSIALQATASYLGIDPSEIVSTGEGRNFIDFRATLIDAVDLHGLPTVDKNAMVAQWVPMGLLPRAGFDADEGVILIDEITNADQSVKGALYGLVLDRRIGEYVVPEGWRIIAAGNRVEDKASASRMPSALSNRFIQITVEPTVDDLVNYFLGKTSAPAELIAFLRFRPELMNDFDGDRAVNATPRSWEMVGDIVNAGMPKESENRMILGAVGEGAGTEFIAFLQVWRDLPNPDSVLMNPDTAPVPDTSAGRYAISAALAKRVREASMDGFAEYLDRLPAEFGVMAMRDATRRDAMLANTKAHIAFQTKYQDVYL